jgi:lipopolysaccharide biosynthesis glycosyltransferase
MYHVAYCFDKNFIQHFCAAVTSCIMNFGKPSTQLHFHLVVDQEDLRLSDFLAATKSIFGCGFSVYVLANNENNALDRIPQSLRNQNHTSFATYFRLLLPELVPVHVDKLLYLDCDTIVIGDISALLEMELKGNPIAMVSDASSEYMCKVHNLSAYYNAGVALLSLNVWRSEELTSKCLAYLENPTTPVKFSDQCAINVVLADRVTELESRWNRFTHESKVETLALQSLRDDHAIIHFFDKEKPWYSWYRNAFGKLYWDYLDVSPWKNAKPQEAVTVDQHILLAKKFEADGKFAQSCSVYSKIVAHFMSKSRAAAS